MDNFFDKSLHYLGRQGGEVVGLNIGAMDGILFDEMIGYTNMYGYKVLYVEPIPYLFEKLKKNITSETAMFENSAISDYEGNIQMMIIDQEAIDKGLVHDCFYGMSAVYPPKNGLASEGDKETVEKYGKLVTVPCITFDQLVEKHNINHFDIVKIDAEGHDYEIFKQIDLSKYRPKSVRLEWVNLPLDVQNIITKTFDDNNYLYEIVSQDITAITKEHYDELLLAYPDVVLETTQLEIPTYQSNVTIVTGIWDIRRDQLSEGWSRNFDHYLNNLAKLMKTNDNMIIFIESRYRSFVEANRVGKKTFIIEKELDWFKSNGEMYNMIQKIRTNPDWYNQTGWIVDSTQAKLEMYNPIVMSKMFLMNDAAILDPFNSTHLVWVDGALTNTVHEGYFWHDNVISNLNKFFNKFSFVCFPYDGKVEIHGFKYEELCQYAQDSVNKVARGGIFGGPKDSIKQVNEIYHNLLMDSLSKGFMGTEESIFTIMVYKYPELFQYFEIEMNGLLGLFFENLKNKNLLAKTEKSDTVKINPHDKYNVALYVLTYNSPNQFEKLCLSFEQYDENFIDKPKKYLLNNSLDRSTDIAYSILCDKYGFEEIKKDNLGICGGRQFIAEHADANGFDYHFFFEDDMFFYLGNDQFCKNGFRRKIQDFYNIVMDIIWNEDFDFLKWNFTEFFGDNSKQWAWHNVPAGVRAELFPEKPVKNTNDVNYAPFLNFKNIKSHKQVPYATGEIYYCNWPQVVSKEGNRKMFLETKWAHPFEQTWMSYMYQETLKNKLNPAILLATPTEHDRFEFYPGSERREN
jgi:FkbM family methyltransferase